jgi:hypothetical protein
MKTKIFIPLVASPATPSLIFDSIEKEIEGYWSVRIRKQLRKESAWDYEVYLADRGIPQVWWSKISQYMQEKYQKKPIF